MKQFILLVVCLASSILNGSQMDMQKEKLLPQNISRTAQDRLSKQFLFAANFHDWDTVKTLLRKYPKLNMNIQDKYGQTALMWADFYHQTKVVKLLIDTGADLEIKDENGRTALELAVIHNFDPDTAKLLIDAGAKLNTQNKKGFTPLISAVFYGKANMVKLLIAAGADITIQNNKDGGKTVHDYIELKDKKNPLLQALEEGIKERQAYLQLQAAAKKELEAQEQLIPVLADIITGYAYGPLPTDLHEQKKIEPKKHCIIM